MKAVAENTWSFALLVRHTEPTIESVLRWVDEDKRRHSADGGTAECSPVA